VVRVSVRSAEEAEAMLWQDRDGEHWVTEPGHVCREAMQAFAAAF